MTFSARSICQATWSSPSREAGRAETKPGISSEKLQEDATGRESMDTKKGTWGYRKETNRHLSGDATAGSQAETGREDDAGN